MSKSWTNPEFQDLSARGEIVAPLVQRRVVIRNAPVTGWSGFCATVCAMCSTIALAITAVAVAATLLAVLYVVLVLSILLRGFGG